MLNPNFNIDELIFIDIETIPCTDNVENLSQHMFETYYQIYEKRQNKDETVQNHFFGNAALYPEYLNIVCVSLGYYNVTTSGFSVLAITGSEIGILNELTKILETKSFYGKRLVAHNGKDFDYPVLIKRYLINRLVLPKIFKLYCNQKPWESSLLDSKEMWRFGGFSANHISSLDRLCSVFGIESPKSDITGKEIGTYYYDSKNYSTEEFIYVINRIAKYCNNDVKALFKVVCDMNQQLYGVDINYSENIKNL